MANTTEQASTAVDTVSNSRAVRAPRTYSSVTGTDIDARKLVYNAVNNAEQVSDHLGEEFLLSNIIQQPTMSEVLDPKTNQPTGEVEEYTRTTLISPDGSALSAGSDGIAGSVDNLIAAFGEPSEWAEPLKVKVIERKSKNKRTFFSIEVL